MKSRIRNFLIGEHTFSAYSKITVPQPVRENVYLEMDGQRVNVSTAHWLLCIEPLVVGVWLNADPGARQYRLMFSDGTVLLDRMESIEEETGVLLLFALRKSLLHHLDPLRTRLIWYRYYRSGGLSFRRFANLVTAYSYPRRIRLVSFRDQAYFNIFPMDLLGEVGDNRYVFGLRHSNSALPAIIRTGKLAVSEVTYTQKDVIYELGRNHSGTPPSADKLPFKIKESEQYGFPVPEFAYGTREIRLLRTMDLGSHMLLWGEILPYSKAIPATDGLYLVHFLHFLFQQRKQPYLLV